jgi:hypothetical protein
VKIGVNLWIRFRLPHFIFTRKKKLVGRVVPNAPPFGDLRQSHFDREEAERRIASIWNIAPAIRQLRFALRFDSRRKRIACAVRRMTELKHRLATLHTKQYKLYQVLPIGYKIYRIFYFYLRPKARNAVYKLS